LADDNGNGIFNLVEYVAGSDLTLGEMKSGEDTFSTISFSQKLGADDVLIVVESSSDLNTWSSSPFRSFAIYHGDGTSFVTWRVLQPIGGSSLGQFLRLRVTKR
jgi:hypothetical protein